MKYFDKNFALDLSKNVISQIDVVDQAAINQSIECILMTDQNERVFEPNFGSFLSGLVFESLDNQSAEKLLDKIITTSDMFTLPVPKGTLKLNNKYILKIKTSLDSVYYVNQFTTF
jgi:hypothetical protein